MACRTDSSGFSGRYRAGLLLLCLLGFALRLYHLEDLFLSDDEALSYTRYLQQPIRHIFTDYQANNHWLINLIGHLTTQGIRVFRI